MFKNISKNLDLPENVGEIIAEIVKKHQLGPVDIFNNPEIEKILEKAKTKEEALRIIKNLPFEKVFDIIEKTAKGEIKINTLSTAIKEELSIPEQKANELTSDLKKQIFQISKEENKNLPPIKKIFSQVEKKEISSKDNYREIIE